MKKIFPACFIIFLCLILFSNKTITKTEETMKETAIFKVDRVKKVIAGLSDNVKNMLKLKFISVTTDQPVYWPDEDVFLKVLLPVNPDEEISVNLQKKDSTPRDIGKFNVNKGGILVLRILSGHEKKLEAGEYRVDVETKDKKLKEYTSFTVVEGALGAVSFAYDFKELTSPAQFQNTNGGWFLGNAAGAGMRWGNGLNIKNEVRVLNNPLSGRVIVKTRCYLPGCNGIEAGQAKEMEIKHGILEGVFDVGGHSGPFEIEVITDKGSVRHLFGRSGHVERQSVQVCSHMSNHFYATLAPYKDTVPVYGKEIYIVKEKTVSDDALELISPVCDASNEIGIKVKKDLKNPKIFAFYFEKSDSFRTEEIKIPAKLESGSTVKIPCASPYTFIAAAGFQGNKADYFEAWSIAFTESPVEIEISAPVEGMPNQNFDVEIHSFLKGEKTGIPVHGILEVFDNRVPSKSAQEPLISSVGDSFRSLSNYLSSWRDWTGIDEEKEEKVMYDMAPATTSKGAGVMKMKAAKRSGVMSFMADTSGEQEAKESQEIQETIREGEKKVVYAGEVNTDEKGFAKVNVKLPPQMGRCKIRFTAVRKFDYMEKTKDIDVRKGNYVELNIQPLITPDSKIFATAHAFNSGKENLKLKISGAGISSELSFEIKPGTNNVEFEVTGEKCGNLSLKLADAKGKILDSREFQIKNIAVLPVTFSDVIILDGSPVIIEKGQKTAVYSNPAGLLKGMIMNIVTTMYSWFGHSESLSASVAIRAMLLRAIEDKIIDDEGLRDTLTADLIKTVNDLYKKFFVRESGLFRPYPGISENELWSLWALKNLQAMLNSFKGSKNLENEFSAVIKLAKEMISGANKALKKPKIAIAESDLYDADSDLDLIPVEIGGKIVFKQITDDAVVKWFVGKMIPALDLPSSDSLKAVNEKFIKAYDTFRFLRAFERTGVIYYLLLNAKALYLKGDSNFFPVFNRIARGMILTQEPGMIQGPALLGGVYSSPQTVVKFLDLLITMAKDKKIVFAPQMEIIRSGNKKDKITLSDKAEILEAKDGSLSITAPAFVTIRIDREKQINMFEYLERKPFFTVSSEKNTMNMGEESEILIQLDKDKDPSEYYAIIAVPSVLAIRQTDDLLSDYKGQLLYGQKTGGGLKIQMITAPFRGSGKMIIHTEASQKGESQGFVLVRHISNPDIIATVKSEKIRVK
jgi:hypothetical protein